MTTIEKLLTAFDRYDDLIHKHITKPIEDRNDPKLEIAAAELNKIAHEAQERYTMEALRERAIEAIKAFNDANHRMHQEMEVDESGWRVDSWKNNNLEIELQKAAVECCAFQEAYAIVTGNSYDATANELHAATEELDATQ
jgi:hypothetical protein